MESRPEQPVTLKTGWSNLPYLVAVLIMSVIAITGVVIITVMRPDQDNMTVIATLLGFLTPTTLSLLAFMKSQETHLSVNSRLDQFIENADSAARAEGINQGVNEANARADDLTRQEQVL